MSFSLGTGSGELQPLHPGGTRLRRRRLAHDHMGSTGARTLRGPRGYVKEFRRFHLDLAEQVGELQRTGRRVVVVSHSLGGLIAFGAVAAGLTKPDFLVLSAPALEARIATWKRVVAPILSRILPMLRIPTGIGADTSPGQRLQNLDPMAPDYLYAVTTRLGDEGFRAQRAARAVVAAGGNFPVPTLVTQGEGMR